MTGISGQASQVRRVGGNLSGKCVLKATNSQLAPVEMESKDCACRCGGVSWGDDDLALLYESWWDTRRSVVYTFAPSRPQEEKKVLFDR